MSLRQRSEMMQRKMIQISMPPNQRWIPTIQQDKQDKQDHQDHQDHQGHPGHQDLYGSLALRISIHPKKHAGLCMLGTTLVLEFFGRVHMHSNGVTGYIIFSFY